MYIYIYIYIIYLYLFIFLSYMNDVSITIIDKTDPSDLLRREDYWRQTLKTMVPCGLNIEDSA